MTRFQTAELLQILVNCIFDQDSASHSRRNTRENMSILLGCQGVVFMRQNFSLSLSNIEGFLRLEFLFLFPRQKDVTHDSCFFFFLKSFFKLKMRPRITEVIDEIIAGTYTMQ